MTYRADGSYLRFKTSIKTSQPLASAGKAMDEAISRHQEKQHLRDVPGVRQNQNVYDNLAE